MSLKCRISTISGKSITGTGLLGVQGRDGKKILQKQNQLLHNLPMTFKKFESYGLDQNHNFMDLLQKILNFNPTDRISP